MPAFPAPQKLWRWAWFGAGGGEFAAKIYVHGGETFGKINPPLYPTTARLGPDFKQQSRFQNPALGQRLLRPRGCRTRLLWGGWQLLELLPRCSLPAINKFRVFNKLMSGGRRGAGRCVPGDISWRAAWQQRGAGREQAGSPGCVPLSWVFWQGGEAGLFGRTFPSGIHLCFPGIGQAAPGSEKSQMCGT